MQTQVGQCLLAFRLVLGTYLLFLAFSKDVVNDLLGNVEAATEVGKILVLSLQNLAMLVHISEIAVDDHSFGRQFPMVASVLGGVQRYELVRHDASTSIYRAVVPQRIVLERVGKVYTVCRHQFATLQAVIDIHGIVAPLALLVRFLNAASGRSIVMGNGQSDHRTVRQVYGSLDESLAKGAAPHYDAPILVLNGSRDNLCCRGGVAVYEHDDFAFCKQSSPLSLVFGALCLTSLRIDYQVIALQELVGYLDSSVQESASVLLQVEHQ